MTHYLKEEHPLTLKFMKLMEYADSLGIRLQVVSDALLFTDLQTGVSAVLSDLESQHRNLLSFPPEEDFRLIKFNGSRLTLR